MIFKSFGCVEIYSKTFTEIFWLKFKSWKRFWHLFPRLCLKIITFRFKKNKKNMLLLRRLRLWAMDLYCGVKNENNIMQIKLVLW